ncbi:hypothetical protein M3_0068 [Lysinibacillus phage vB_LfM_LysYB1]|nr:hypothetical protein M3_0068 [Lysinibacillus phage vB_LfM_LysYB1]WAB25189.1 hypothetical protein M5_0011 [Lysinibacillus phage vB_LfM_LysYB2]
MSMSVENAMVKFFGELDRYTCSKKFPGGMVVHFNPVGESGYYIGTLTAYNEQGEKSDKAIPFQKYMKTVNEIEDLLQPYQGYEFTGILVGWNPTTYVKSFLFNKKVHRLFFLHHADVLKFIESYTTPERIAAREADVVVTFG